MFSTYTTFTVRYAETDAMGIVHHSNYPIWFEAGRTDFIKQLGMSYSEIEKRGLMLPLLELKCCYKGAARYEDEITVKTSLKEMSYTRLIFRYEVFKNGDQELITTGETMHVWTNSQLKPVNLKKAAPDIYHLIESIKD